IDESNASAAVRQVIEIKLARAFASLLITPLLTASSCSKALANFISITCLTAADALLSSIRSANGTLLRPHKSTQTGALQYEHGKCGRRTNRPVSSEQPPNSSTNI